MHSRSNCESVFCTCVRQVDLWGPLYCSPLAQDGGIHVTNLYIGREKEKTRCKQKCILSIIGSGLHVCQDVR